MDVGVKSSFRNIGQPLGILFPGFYKSDIIYFLHSASSLTVVRTSQSLFVLEQQHHLTTSYLTSTVRIS